MSHLKNLKTKMVKFNAGNEYYRIIRESEIHKSKSYASKLSRAESAEIYKSIMESEHVMVTGNVTAKDEHISYQLLEKDDPDQIDKGLFDKTTK
jgi:hypothetical protein